MTSGERSRGSLDGISSEAAYQVGVQKTIPLSIDDAWALLSSRKGIACRLGRASRFKLAEGTNFRTDTGIAMTEQKQPRAWLSAVPVLLVIAALIGMPAFQLRSGVRVTVQNAGTTPLKSVVLHVTGATYALDDIAPGESATMRVNPTGESHLEVEFTDIDGQTQRLNAGGYFESGYRGSIRVEIDDGQISEIDENVKLW